MLVPGQRDRPSVSPFYWLAALLLLLLFIALVSGGLPFLNNPFPPGFVDVSRPWLLILVVVLGTKVLLDVFKPLFRAGLRNRVPSEADIFALYQLFSYAAWIAGMGFAVYIFVGGNIAEIGVVGGAVVLGVLIYVLQEPLLNVVGWMILVTRRIYKLGDRIEVNGTKGYVVSISPMNTTLREFGGSLSSSDLFTGRYVTVPNKSVLVTNVFNYTKDTPFVWAEVHVSVTYESDHRRAEELIRESAEEIVGALMQKSRDAIRQKYEFRDLMTYMIEEPTVRWRLSDSCVDLTVVFFCPAYRKGYYTSEVTKRILEKFAMEPAVEIAYPHMQMVPSERTSTKWEAVAKH